MWYTAKFVDPDWDSRVKNFQNPTSAQLIQIYDSCQLAVKTANNSCQTAVTIFETIDFYVGHIIELCTNC